MRTGQGLLLVILAGVVSGRSHFYDDSANLEASLPSPYPSEEDERVGLIMKSIGMQPPLQPALKPSFYGHEQESSAEGELDSEEANQEFEDYKEDSDEQDAEEDLLWQSTLANETNAPSAPQENGEPIGNSENVEDPTKNEEDNLWMANADSLEGTQEIVFPQPVERRAEDQEERAPHRKEQVSEEDKEALAPSEKAEDATNVAVNPVAKLGSSEEYEEEKELDDNHSSEKRDEEADVAKTEPTEPKENEVTASEEPKYDIEKLGSSEEFEEERELDDNHSAEKKDEETEVEKSEVEKPEKNEAVPTEDSKNNEAPLDQLGSSEELEEEGELDDNHSVEKKDEEAEVEKSDPVEPKENEVTASEEPNNGVEKLGSSEEFEEEGELDDNHSAEKKDAEPGVEKSEENEVAATEEIKNDAEPALEKLGSSEELEEEGELDDNHSAEKKDEEPDAGKTEPTVPKENESSPTEETKGASESAVEKLGSSEEFEEEKEIDDNHSAQAKDVELEVEKTEPTVPKEDEVAPIEDSKEEPAAQPAAKLSSSEEYEEESELDEDQLQSSPLDSGKMTHLEIRAAIIAEAERDFQGIIQKEERRIRMNRARKAQHQESIEKSGETNDFTIPSFLGVPAKEARRIKRAIQRDPTTQPAGTVPIELPTDVTDSTGKNETVPTKIQKDLPKQETLLQDFAVRKYTDPLGWTHFPWKEFPITKMRYRKRKECACEVIWIKRVYKRHRGIRRNRKFRRSSGRSGSDRSTRKHSLRSYRHRSTHSEPHGKRHHARVKKLRVKHAFRRHRNVE